MTATSLIAALVFGQALQAYAACTPNTTDLQATLKQGGAGYTLSLCQSQRYSLKAPLQFTAANQEISTEGYPSADLRATLVVEGINQTTAIQGTAPGLDGAKLRHVQIDGNREDANAYPTPSGANIEMGGDTTGQLIEFVRTFDPRGWSCLHIAEGQLNCTNVTVQRNDIGPCGSDLFGNWADGISLSCADSLVADNTILDATDGGIVIFGAPFSTIRDNHISVKTRTMLGGINLVDIVPWLPNGNYTHTVVENNVIHGGFATSYGNDTQGLQNESALIKIGIALGPEVWFGTQFGTNKSRGGVIQGNEFSGAFTFGMAVASAQNFIVQNNTFAANVSFIGDYAENCTVASQKPHPPTALLAMLPSLVNVTLTPGKSATEGDNYTFENGTALALTCFKPPSGNVWPYGDGFNAQSSSSEGSSGSPTGSSPGAQTSVPGTKDSKAVATWPPVEMLGLILPFASVTMWLL